MHEQHRIALPQGDTVHVNAIDLYSYWRDR
jgi:hypothetical protein